MTQHGLEQRLSRRALLAAGCASAVWLAPNLAFSAAGGAAPPLTLVCMFLRGAVDGLSLVVPHSEPAYYEARPTIAIAPPKRAGGALDLDGRFGLHPRLATLKPAFEGSNAFSCARRNGCAGASKLLSLGCTPKKRAYRRVQAAMR